jgi:hypothetical protein
VLLPGHILVTSEGCVETAGAVFTVRVTPDLGLGQKEVVYLNAPFHLRLRFVPPNNPPLPFPSLICTSLFEAYTVPTPVPLLYATVPDGPMI